MGEFIEEASDLRGSGLKMRAKSFGRRLSNMSRELRYFAVASFTMGVAYSLIDSTLNNYLNERFTLSGFQRSFLEFPRELPGFLCVFITALLWFLCSRRLGVVSMLLGAAGALLIGFVSPTYGILVMCLFIYSLGQHIFMPAASTIGMELAKEGQTGQRLGQLNSLRNLASIFGSFLVFMGFKYLGFTFQHTFALAAGGFVIAAVLMFAMKPDQPKPSASFLKLHKEYRLYYVLAVLYGSRKQLFITFAPWVLVTIFQQPTQVLATLLMIGGVIGILFQPLLGWMIDRLGERFVLVSEAVLLVVVCAGYGFSKFLFPQGIAFLIVCACFLLDQMLMSVNMARATFMKKIARQAADIQPALTAGVTIDHVFSISVALLGGWIWNTFGFQYVFLLGAGIALINLFAALQIRLIVKQENPAVVSD
jgi:predicted MFS family arabinose efflux permease